MLSWMEYRGVHFDHPRREEWAEEAARKLLRTHDGGVHDFTYTSSGNRMVVTIRDGDDIRSYDCLIERVGRNDPRPYPNPECQWGPDERDGCTECGHDHPKWSGRCEACGEWNRLRGLR